jgi:flagellar L-ring protein precursor FlgH
MTGAEMIIRRSFYWLISVLWIVLASTGCAAKAPVKVTDPTDLRDYVEHAKQTQDSTGAGTGSLWTTTGQNSSLFGDLKARYVNDVVTILVSESTQAVASADASNARSTSATAGFSNLFGAEKLIKELPSLVSGTSDSKFTGSGSTSRATTLSTTLTARVTDVLPNGYLVVEGKREIRVNNENQSVILTGIIRPNDISKSNMVPSSAVAQMSVYVQGKGTVSQPTKPGWLYKILTSYLPF